MPSGMRPSSKASTGANCRQSSVESRSRGCRFLDCRSPRAGEGPVSGRAPPNQAVWSRAPAGPVLKPLADLAATRRPNAQPQRPGSANQRRRWLLYRRRTARRWTIVQPKEANPQERWTIQRLLEVTLDAESRKTPLGVRDLQYSASSSSNDLRP